LFKKDGLSSTVSNPIIKAFKNGRATLSTRRPNMTRPARSAWSLGPPA